MLGRLFGGSKKKPVIQGFSIQGRKPAQEDAFYTSEVTENGVLILVADGVGGAWSW